MSFSAVSPEALDCNLFRAIGKDWMLISAGSADKMNTMTASWGGTGVLWNKNVSMIFVRKSRYTLEFLEKEPYYTLSFFGGEKKKELGICGKVSGRDQDKIALTGLTPVFEAQAPYFEEASLVLVCRKLYRQTMEEACVIDKEAAAAFYAQGDWHELFVGEIVQVLQKDETT